MGRRTLLLITSLLVAAVGTALIGLYVRGADDRAQDYQSPQTVLVATRDIAANATADQVEADVQAQQRPAGTLPDGYLSSLAGVGSQVATGPIYKNQVIEQQMFTATGALTPSAPSGNDVWLSVDLSDTQRVAGLLTVGSQVRIFGFRTGDGGKSVYRVLPNAVTVIQIGNDKQGSAGTSTGTGGSSGSGTGSGQTGTTTDDVSRAIVGLDLSEKEAIIVKQAEVNGGLTFALLRPEATPTPTPAS